MRPILAAPTFWTEASQVEWTELIFLDVLQRAVWTEWTESAIVVRTRRPLGFGVDMEVQAVVAVGACERAGVVGAFRHAAQVVLV
jgi:hypothetical protein